MSGRRSQRADQGNQASRRTGDVLGDGRATRPFLAFLRLELARNVAFDLGHAHGAVDAARVRRPSAHLVDIVAFLVQLPAAAAASLAETEPMVRRHLRVERGRSARGHARMVADRRRKRSAAVGSVHVHPVVAVELEQVREDATSRLGRLVFIVQGVELRSA